MADSWDLSPLYRHSATAFLPDHAHLVQYSNARLVLRSAHDLAIHRTWSLAPTSAPVLHASAKPPLRPTQPTSSSTRTTPPTGPAGKDPALLAHLQVSPQHPHFILVHLAKQATATVLDPSRDEPVAVLHIGPEGAEKILWSPLGHTLLVWSNFHMRITLYNLSSDRIPPLYIAHPKLYPPHGCSFSPDGRYFALVERHSGRDSVGVYDAASGDWKLLRHFAMPSVTTDVADLEWSPCGRYLAIWETLTDYQIHIYTPTGRLLSSFSPPSPDKVPDDKDRAPTLGIRVVKWHPSGDWLAVGGWDGKVRILTRLTWSCVGELGHVGRVAEALGGVYQEPRDWITKTRGKGIVAFEARPLPFNPPPSSRPPDLTRVNPKIGVSEMRWSPSGKFLATYCPTYPKVLWIHTFLSPHPYPRLHSLVVLDAAEAVTAFAWSPQEGRDVCVIADGSKSFVVWRPEGVDGVGIPARTEFGPTSVTFDGAGKSLLLSDRDLYALAYPVSEHDDEGSKLEERSWAH